MESHSVKSDGKAWAIIRAFATEDNITLPEAESHLQNHLGDRYVDEDWRPALKAVMDAEGDVNAALSKINELQGPTSFPRLTIRIPARQKPIAPPQLQALECELMKAVSDLGDRRRIIGTLPTLDDLLNPPEENEHEYVPEVEGDHEIVKDILHQMAVAHGEVIEVESEPEDGGEEEAEPKMSTAELAKLCRQLER